MIKIKTNVELKNMAEGGHILSEVVRETVDAIKPGISEKELDALAEKLILEKGAQPGFKKVEGYRNAICISTNDVVVHGIPTDYKIREGDVVGIDCGVFYKGFHTDMSETIAVETTDEKVRKFLDVGRRALHEAIKVACVGNRVGHISEAIQQIVEKENGYSIVRSLVGHGVGRELHEEPEVPGFLSERTEDTPELVEGMTLAVEVIYNMGGPDVIMDPDNWTIRSKDKSISGVFERTIEIRGDNPLILTPWSAII